MTPYTKYAHSYTHIILNMRRVTLRHLRYLTLSMRGILGLGASTVLTKLKMYFYENFKGLKTLHMRFTLSHANVYF
jgi:hypothetical protein